MRAIFYSVVFAALAVRAFAGEFTGPNSDVLKIAYEFKDGGHYNRAWKGSGSPEEIRFKGEKILSAAEGGTYCCGYTFAVVMRAAEARGLLRDKTPEQIRRFQKEWYGATNADKDKLCALALPNLGIGREVPFDEAKPGDFCQFWRGKGGHSVIFLNWIEENGEKIGIRYRSSQTSTDGIGDRNEYFKAVHGQKDPLNRDRTYFGRLNAKAAAGR
jgi:hypothetical protein